MSSQWNDLMWLIRLFVCLFPYSDISDDAADWIQKLARHEHQNDDHQCLGHVVLCPRFLGHALTLTWISLLVLVQFPTCIHLPASWSPAHGVCKTGEWLESGGRSWQRDTDAHSTRGL